MAAAGITTRHHLPSTNPTSSSVGITWTVYARRDFGLTAGDVDEENPAGARERCHLESDGPTCPWLDGYADRICGHAF